MHRLKGKVEAYVVSTMEDNQRTSLLDNLAISIEKVDEEAEKEKEKTNERVVRDEKMVDDLCESILFCLEHELKVTNNRQKPSFWDVAEHITPKDTIKMIYRLNIQQTDKTRCHAWARLALKEATISSYISLLRDDNQLLKDWYKSSAFVRDKMKMDTAFELINEAVSNTIFSFSIENRKDSTASRFENDGISPEFPQEILYTAHTASSSSIDTTSVRKKKGRSSSRSSAITPISDGSSSIPNSWSESHVHDNAAHHSIARSYNDSNLTRVWESSGEKETGVGEHEGGITEQESPSGTLKIFGSLTHSELSPFKEVIPHGIRERIPSTSELIESQEKGNLLKDVEKSDANEPALNITDGGESTEDSDKDLAANQPNVFDGEVNDVDYGENFHQYGKSKDGVSVEHGEKPLLDSQSFDIQMGEENLVVLESSESLNELSIVTEHFSEQDNDHPAEPTYPFSHPEPDNQADDSLDADAGTDRPCTPTPYDTYDQADYSMFENESREITDDVEENDSLGIQNSNSFSGGSQQLVNVLQLSTSVSSTDDYFIPGIHKSPDVETMQQKSDPIVSPSRKSSTHHKEAADSKRSATLPSTFGSSVSSSAYTFGSEDSESDSLSIGDQSFSFLADLGITDDFIGMKEDHFSTPESFMGFSSTEELENAIATCKQLIKQANEKSPGRKELIQQLVQLRLKLHESRESPVEVPKNAKKVLGHHFIKQDKLVNSIPCDRCSSTIFPMLQVVYQCRDCGFHCHRKCLRSLDKGCIFSKQTANSTCEMRICPEVTLSQQQFRCADCHQRLVEADGQFDARLCDYTGKQYCGQCHWNESMTIPARVIHNWDFVPRKVSRQSKQLLQLRYKKADINLQKINPALFNFLDELRNIKTLREQLIMMKEYIRTCRIATEERMLLQLQNRQHFVENSFVFSMQDLMDVHSNALYDELSKKIQAFGKHIKADCPLCIGKGFICEKCRSDEIIFPFDDHVIRCKCKATYHRSCFIEDECPRCIRTARRKEDNGKQDDEENNSNTS